MKFRSTIASVMLAFGLSAALVTGPLALTGCSVLGVPKAESFNERVAFALTGVTAVRESALALLRSAAITAADAQNIQDQADNARVGIDLAVSVHATNPESADNRLLAAQVIVDALRAYLRSKS